MVIDTYSRTARPAVHTIAPESCPMMLSTMPDGPKPVANSSGYATTRRGRSDDLAVTGAGGEERCGEAEPSRARTWPRVRPIAPGLCSTIKTLRLHRHLPMGTRPSLSIMPIRSPNRLSEGPRGVVLHATRRAVERSFATLYANHCTGIIVSE
jgi:hypothetical protein